MIKILINGINGKMGTEVAKQIKKHPNMYLLGGFDRHIIHNLGFPVYNDFNNIFELPNVVIDFSAPESTINFLNFAKSKKIALVIAKTGFNQEQKDQILEASDEIPIFLSANMSYEIFLMKDIVSNLSQKLPNSEIEIIETHHSEKTDSPSGTALSIADAIQSANNNKYFYKFDRMQKHEKRNPNEIGFSSIRGGNIIGEHSVMFFNENECLEIKHTAYSRSIFAEGALKAAEFIVKQSSGYYVSL